MEDFLEPYKTTKGTDGKILKQKCTSVQKLDKDMENRSKKSNILLNANMSEEIRSQPEIATDSIGPSSSSESSINFSVSNEIEKQLLKNIGAIFLKKETKYI